MGELAWSWPALRSPSCARRSSVEGVPVDREPRFLKAPEPELQAQIDRKRRSIAIMEALCLPWLETLPVVEDESKLVPRDRDEVAARYVATEICAIKGE